MNTTKHNRRKNTLEGVKILLASVSITAMIFFWAKFSRDDQVAKAANLDIVVAAQDSYVISIPTLVPFEWEEENEDERPSNQNQPLELRSVTAPQPQTSPTFGGPIVVGGKGGGGGGSPVTSTGSS